MRLLVKILAVFGIFVVLAILFTYVQLAYHTPAGLGEVDENDIVKPIVLAAASLLGILSKSMFDVLREKDNQKSIASILTKSLSLGNMLLAVLISPIVIISLYNSLQQISDIILVGLTAYQNGFFVETVLQARESKVRKDG